MQNARAKADGAGQNDDRVLIGVVFTEKTPVL
jgi:hypothetical protein